jgi:hypothetical protein
VLRGGRERDWERTGGKVKGCRLAATQACLNVQAEGDTQKRVLVLYTLLYTLGMILRQCVHTSAFTLNVRVHMHMALKAILVPFSDKSKPFLPSPHD